MFHSTTRRGRLPIVFRLVARFMFSGCRRSMQRLRLAFWFGMGLGFVTMHLLGRRLWFRLRFGSFRIGRRAVDKLRNGRLDGFVGGQLCFGIEVELAVLPAQSADHRLVAGHALVERMKKVTEQKIKCAGTTVVTQRQRASGTLRLRLLKQRPQLGFS